MTGVVFKEKADGILYLHFRWANFNSLNSDQFKRSRKNNTSTYLAHQNTPLPPLAQRGFSLSGYSGFPLSSKTNIWFDLFVLISVDLLSPQLVEHSCSATVADLGIFQGRWIERTEIRYIQKSRQFRLPFWLCLWFALIKMFTSGKQYLFQQKKHLERATTAELYRSRDRFEFDQGHIRNQKNNYV